MRWLSACGFLLFPGSLLPQTRPASQVEPAAPLDHGALRVDIGMLYRDGVHLSTTDLVVDELAFLDTGLSYGFADGVELQLRSPLVFTDLTRNITDAGDITLAAKFRIPRLFGCAASSVRAGVKLPQTDNTYHLGTDELDYFTDLLLTWSRPGWELHSTVGISIDGDPIEAGAQNDYFRYGIAWYRHGKRLDPLVELAGKQGPGGPGIVNTRALTFGMRFPRRGYTWYGGWSVGLGGESDRYAVSGGLSWTKSIH